MHLVYLRFFVLIFLIGMFKLNAQFKPNKFYAGGSMILDPIEEIKFGGEFSSLSEKYVYSLVYNQSAGDEWEALGPNPEEKFNELNLMFGKFHDTTNQKFRVQYQAGLGAFWGEKITDDQDTSDLTESFSTIGVPLRVGGKFIPFDFFAVGIDLHVNINSENTVFLPMFSLNLGQLR